MCLWVTEFCCKSFFDSEGLITVKRLRMTIAEKVYFVTRLWYTSKDCRFIVILLLSVHFTLFLSPKCGPFTKILMIFHNFSVKHYPITSHYRIIPSWNRLFCRANGRLFNGNNYGSCQIVSTGWYTCCPHPPTGPGLICLWRGGSWKLGRRSVNLHSLRDQKQYILHHFWSRTCWKKRLLYFNSLFKGDHTPEVWY